LHVRYAIDSTEVGLEEFLSTRAENSIVEESGDAVEERIFSDPHGQWVIGVTPNYICTEIQARLAHVVGGLSAVRLSEHATTAHIADYVRPEHVAPFRLGVLFVQTRATSRPLANPWYGGGSLERFTRNDRLVSRFRRPHPSVGRIYAATFFRCPAIPHHVTRVLGIGEDSLDRRRTPAALASGGIGGDGGRITVRVRVKALRYVAVAEALVSAPARRS
jgi:hypothetical protein